MIEKSKSPKRKIKHKRLSRDCHSSSSCSTNDSSHLQPTTDTIYENIPDSFRVYRANTARDVSDSDDLDLSDISGSACSSCSGISVSGSDSEYDSTSKDEGSDCESETNTKSTATDNFESGTSTKHSDSSKSISITDQNKTFSTRSSAAVTSLTSTNLTALNVDVVPSLLTSSVSDGNISTLPHHVLKVKPPLEPLQLVWAKCRGYPWYPALILDPQTPKGFVYNGVPLPAPPPDVLSLRKNYEGEVFLVLFFDAKRTWQWLPETKLEILGIDKELDQNKLIESRKPTERKAVKKAYQDALHYQSQVSDLEGQGPDPIM